MFAGQFTPRSAERSKSLIEDIVGRTLDAMEQAGPPLDLYKAFCLSIPAQFIATLLGADPTEARRFEDPTEVIVNPRSSTAEALAAKHAFDDFVRELIQRKRDEPADDLLTKLVQGGELSDEEIVALGRPLFQAGHETTASMLGLSVMVLLQDRARWEALRTDPTIAATVVEEMLRYHTIIHQIALPRTALEDVEIAGVTIRAGEAVAVSMAAANRDPHKFADPDRLDITRKDSGGHLAFGFGIHQCLGQHFARLELQVGIVMLADRFPSLALAVPMDDIPMSDPEANSYGPKRIPVTW
jgi:cytochrome P450